MANIITLASALLLVGVSFFVFDGVLTITTCALRGLNDTAYHFSLPR